MNFVEPSNSAPSVFGGRSRAPWFMAILFLLSSVFSAFPGTDAQAAKSSKAKATKAAKAVIKAKAKAKARITLGDIRRTKEQRAKVQAQARQTAARVDALKADQAQVEKKLASLNGTVRVTSVALDKAQRAATAATAEARTARANETALRAKLATLQARSYQAALTEVVAPSAENIDALLTTGSVGDSDRRQVLTSLGRKTSADIIDATSAAREDLTTQRAIADRAEKKAKGYRAAVSEKLVNFKQARTQQQKFADEVEQRLEEQLAEAESVKAIDAKLAAQFDRQNELLAAQLRVAGAGAGGSGGGSYSIPAGLEVAVGGSGDTHGIKVAASIHGQLASMLAAAKSDGLYLTGGGYRTVAGQIQLRRAHCGSSTYAIYHAKASSCHPPTARPGFSQHGKGLAIDFQYKGQSLNRSSPAYRWLRANAFRFGFKNLPSEPWHWSTTGR